MKAKFFLLTLLFMFVGTSFAESTVTLNRYDAASNAEIIINEAVRNIGGPLSASFSMSLGASPISFRERTPAFQNTNKRWSSASPLIIGKYEGNVVNIYDTMPGQNGKVHYRLRNEVTGTTLPIYIRIEQKLFFPTNGNGVSQYVDLIDLQNKGLSGPGQGWYEIWINAAKGNNVIECAGGNGTYTPTVICQNGNFIFSLSNEYNNRDVNVSFFMPKTPSSPIIIPRIMIGRSEVRNLCISPGDGPDAYAAANECTKNANPTDLIDYYLQVTLTPTTTCKAGETTKTIDLGSLSVTKLAGKGQGGKPDGYTPVETKIEFKCTGDMDSTFANGVLWSMTGVGNSLSPSAASNGILLVQGTGISSLGVKITDVNGNLIKVDGSQHVKPSVDNNIATAVFYAYPTPATSTNPTGAGDYQASATLMFEIP
ncbi:fimbrial protein [Enterobacter sp. ENT03]|uniref:fimbrial protein n=1 Tax=Enterobacter sp. ENT03 TaxID=2854780 RepID=UPI001C456505|nr:fimbrial protein [Enterobacter sp. ENT03]MBV7406561.1 fimbrial protein [Enterobacter sp. ENT03]